ncbi:hypothetical protein OpiT1DRAFT_02462 [Opitutaceae bacterium TAV1]|nr:hypothetical protein OPIT5_14000 [Opitutaceae bacterium TAV5]EIP98012.1 hypothetical protein OpiT1DRAFT_02462 [Opitutaceae bacterium TAV1]
MTEAKLARPSGNGKQVHTDGRALSTAHVVTGNNPPGLPPGLTRETVPARHLLPVAPCPVCRFRKSESLALPRIMKSIRTALFSRLASSVHAALPACAMLVPVLVTAQVTPVNLLIDNSTVRSSGSYTYYARGTPNVTSENPNDGIARWTVPFFPGSNSYSSTTDKDAGATVTWNQNFGVTNNAGPISFTHGELTDGVIDSTSSVSGYNGAVNFEKGFDLLFDLGGLYSISSVEIVYSDAINRRWNTADTKQSVWISETFPTSSSSLTQLGSNEKATLNAPAGSLLTFSSAESIVGRYVNLSLFMSTSYDFSSNGQNGGRIFEVRIFGTPIPEPGTVAIWTAFVSLVVVAGVRIIRKRNPSS